MSLTTTPAAERIHIGFFGLRNAGKSSLVNAVTGQPLSLVSDIKGTTTDPVKKAMELLPLGPVLIIDTPGLDDDQETLGALRVKKAKEILATVHMAVLVVDATRGKSAQDVALEQTLQERKIPYIVAYNKADLLDVRPPPDEHAMYVSAARNEGIHALKERLGAFAEAVKNSKVLLKDLITAKDTVVLVTPIDESAPKGRIILPQQMTLRELLDAHATAIVCQPDELAFTLSALRHPPRMVVTDSQVFGKVAAIVPPEISLTSFSILMARYKGDLAALVSGAAVLMRLRDGDRVLICEGCTHHRQCNDIGTVKMPGWIEQFSGAKPAYDFTSGGAFPDDLSPYRLIVHCGGCMLQENEMQRRLTTAAAAGIPIVNYGIAIAAMHGILSRSLQLFPEVLALLDQSSR
ncbi:MAG: [Clostridia bacterium]|nr:[FeFe] hydrogenase H-cluster maturation GTPase HydF [Clostridia bacterium]